MKLSKLDSELAELLRQANPCEGQSCGNCRFSAIERGDTSTGCEAYLYCNHPQNYEEDEGFYALLTGYADAILKAKKPNEFFEDIVGRNCPLYAPIMAKHCSYCKATLNVAEHLAIKAQTLYDGVPVCSEECAAKLKAKEREEHKSYVIGMIEFNRACEEYFS